MSSEYMFRVEAWLEKDSDYYGIFSFFASLLEGEFPLSFPESLFKLGENYSVLPPPEDILLKEVRYFFTVQGFGLFSYYDFPLLKNKDLKALYKDTLSFRTTSFAKPHPSLILNEDENQVIVHKNDLKNLEILSSFEGKL